MTTYNTGNPIGSTDARDRLDNSENLDLAVNSLSHTYVDRLGRTRDTLEGIYQKSAYYRAGTFDAGYTLTNNRQTLAYGNVEYSWSGAFPKVVSAGSTPETTGGIGAGAWVDRTDVTLRADIEPSVIEALRRSYAEAGLNLVDGSFDEGGTLTSSSDVLLHKASGKAYSWTGAYPVGGYVVAPGTDPTAVGSGYVPRTDALLRDELAASDSTTEIAGQPAKEVAKYTAPFIGGVERKLKDRLQDRVSIRDFGVLGNGTEETAKIQQAVTEVLGKGRTLVVPPPTVGNHYICQDIQFPNSSWKMTGDGGPTIVQFATPNGVSNQNIFDLTGCNGPAKYLEGIGFARLTSGSYDGIVGILTNGSNGLHMLRCWFRGLACGFQMNGTLFECDGNVFEYCGAAIVGIVPASESLIRGTIYYRNERDIVIPSGNNSTFVHSDSTHIGTRTIAILLDGASNAQIQGVTAKDDNTGYTPSIVTIANGRGNQINGVHTTFGGDAISILGAPAVGNVISNITAIGVQRGVFISVAPRTKIIGAEIVSASVAGYRIDTAASCELHAASAEACAVGLSINALSEFRMYGGGFQSSTTADTAQDANNSTAPRFYGTLGYLAPITNAVYV